MYKGLSNVYTAPTKFIFIHIPKTAGTSITRWLDEDIITQNCHHTVRQYSEILQDQYPSFFKFAIVRNPWDRMLSLYKYYMSYDLVAVHKTYQHNLLKAPKKEPFLTWLKKMDGHKFVGRTQLSFLTDGDNNTNVDFVGKFENLEADLITISNKIQIPLPPTMFHELPTKHKHYRDEYDEETKNMVDIAFKDDIDHFDYKF